MKNINNQFKGISITSHEGDSKIKIRRSFNPFHFGSPLAIVNCGNCPRTYKQELFYLMGSYFAVDENLECPNCLDEDSIHYEKTN